MKDLIKVLFICIGIIFLPLLLLADAAGAIEQASGIIQANQSWLVVAGAIVVELLARYAWKSKDPQGLLQWCSKLCRALAAFAQMLADMSDLILKQRLKKE